MAIDPKGADLKAMLAEDAGGPVVMLNLLRIAPASRAGDLRTQPLPPCHGPYPDSTGHPG
jgi:hypothetical protein